jgi:hypothetical protein
VQWPFYSVSFATAIGGDPVSLFDGPLDILRISNHLARIAMLPFVAERRDIRLLALIVGVATVATVLVLRFARRVQGPLAAVGTWTPI